MGKTMAGMVLGVLWAVLGHTAGAAGGAALAPPGARSTAPARGRAEDPPPRSADRAAADTLGSAKEIERHFDRAKIRALAEYVRSGERADVETAYMILFNAVIEHDLFHEFETEADQYLAARSFGAVTPLARAVKTMALAHRSDFDQAARSYRKMLDDIGDQNARFAWTFGDALAQQALASGQYAAARDVYGLIRKKFPDDTEIAQRIEPQLRRMELVGQAAPRFDATALDGKKINLADYHNNLVLIDFWATWCGPCIEEFPNLRAAYDKYHARGFDVVGVTLDDDPAAVREFLKEHPVPWRQIVNAEEKDKESDIVNRYRVDRIPATFLIDREGKVRRIDLRGERLDQAVGALLAPQSASGRK
jgi:peroxiredoxin